MKITIRYCKKHETWDSGNCPECMLADNSDELRREGMQEVVDWVETHSKNVYYYDTRNSYVSSISRKDWQSFKESKGL